jgi:hypothetical protein
MLLAMIVASLDPSPIERPVRTEIIAPIRNDTFDKGGTAKKRRQGGNARTMEGLLVFDGSNDGDRQVDPQIAVGGGYILHGTNSGLVIYDKKGNYVSGVPQDEFAGGIDPKLFYDPHNRVFGFNLWVYWDEAKTKPVNVSVSETSDPRGAWNTYPVPAPQGVDGGGIGYSRRWIGYSFPGGDQNTFVMRMSEAKAGRPATVFHFRGSLGHPVFTQDPIDDLWFVELTDADIVMRQVGDDGAGAPVVKRTVRRPHRFARFGWPRPAPQKGTEATVAPGDRNPKNLVVQGGRLWFSHTVDVGGRAGVQWHEVRLSDGRFLQSGVLRHPVNSYIQTTLAVNRRRDVLVGFQETGPDMFVSPRLAFRKSTDAPGTLRGVVRIGEGLAATAGGPWGDYSGAVVDGDDHLTMWTIQSIANEQGRGGTVIARVPAPR